jgi:excisionase family DNA binding protein
VIQMTRDELLSLPATVNVETAGRALGCSRAFAYELVRRGEFPCRVLRLGRKYVIPTADLLQALGVVDGGADAHGAVADADAAHAQEV